jgi:hypothetical protein
MKEENKTRRGRRREENVKERWSLKWIPFETIEASAVTRRGGLSTVRYGLIRWRGTRATNSAYYRGQLFLPMEVTKIHYSMGSQYNPATCTFMDAGS